MNVPPMIAVVISSGKASMADLGSSLGMEDLYDLIEIIQVDAENNRRFAEYHNPER